jgi:hypothetical protein
MTVIVWLPASKKPVCESCTVCWLAVERLNVALGAL